jgi:hypothetical protein
MSATVDYQMTRDQRELLTNLRISDEATQGRPQLPAAEVALARDYMLLLLVDDRAEIAHIELLQEFYRARFRYPLSRRFWQGGPRPPLVVVAGFRHNQLLPEQTARAVAERGPDVLSPDELAVLLLNPYALWDLADLIDFVLPDYWLGRMDQVGRELMERHGLEVAIPGVDEATAPERELKRKPALMGSLRGQAHVEAHGAGCWSLSFSDEAGALARRIAEHAYGDAETAFTLVLYRVPVPSQSDLFQAAVEVSPAPTKNDLVLVVTFPVAGERTFTLEVPPELKFDPAAEPREKTRSEPCCPLPAGAFDLKGGSEWRDDAWPPVLDLR